MRNPDGTLNGDLNDNIPALTSGSIGRYDSSSLDENQTTYDLLPVIVNRPPTIIASITDTSTPSIKPYATADASGNHMYIFPDDSVKVNLGSTVTLRLRAEQPDVFNVENGIPKILPSSAGLTYVWKKDGKVIVTYTLDSLQSKMTVDKDTLMFENIQPEHAGSYTCEVSNDIGTSVSEPITLEVLNLDFDSFFYKNLILNPYGKDGTDNWESSSPDLISKPFSKTPSQEFLRPYNMNLFGYTQDMLHPRPYQIDTGVEKGFDMTKDLLKDGAYFTRTRYSYIKNGGNFLVRAYQDVDLTDIEWLIKGGVWGVEGVRAIFSCYIGNGVGSYIPANPFVDPINKTNPRNYVSNKPRLSVENFLNSGPSYGPRESVYVTLEEFDNETRLSSRVLNPDGTVETKTDRIAMNDPWSKRMGKYWNQKYYTLAKDKYFIGQESSGDGRDMTLFTAEELMPDENQRYTHGQYAEFNKVVLDRLNPNTTKIRVTMHFETSDANLFENWLITLEATDDPFEFIGYQLPFARHSFNTVTPPSWENTINQKILALERNKGKTMSESLPTGPDPRIMVTGLNLMLLPILKQNKAATDYYTQITLAQNTTPESIVPSGLTPGRSYDPFGKNTRRLNVSFGLNVLSDPKLETSGLITQDVDFTLALNVFDPNAEGNTQSKLPKVLISSQSLFPFAPNAQINVEGANTPTTKNQYGEGLSDPDEVRAVQQYFDFKYKTTGSNGQVLSQNTSSLSSVADTLNGFGYIVDYNNKDRLSEPSQDVPSHWNNKARYELVIATPGKTRPGTNASPLSTGLQNYILTLDFSSGSAYSGSTKVTLSRSASMWPGTGSVSVDLSHSIDPYGVLHMKIPGSIVSGTEVNGGLGYTLLRGTNANYPTKKSVKVTGSLISCVSGMRKNVMEYANVPLKDIPYYKATLDSVLTQLNNEIAKASTFLTSSVDYYVWNDSRNLSGKGFGLTDPSPTTSSLFLAGTVSNVEPVYSTIDSQIFWVWEQQNLGQYTSTYNIVEGYDEPTNTFRKIKVIRPTGSYSGSFTRTQLMSFKTALTNYAYSSSYTISSTYAEMDKAFSGSLVIDLLDEAFTQNEWVNGVYGKQIKVPPHINDIATARLTFNERPSLVAVKVVTPDAFNDGVGSPSFGSDKVSGLDYSVTYKVLKDSYTKDVRKYGP